jgi:hypothetical protein
MRGYFAEVVAPFLVGIVLGAYFTFLIALSFVGSTYKKCRYYDQTIERCVQELGWEKK